MESDMRAGQAHAAEHATVYVVRAAAMEVREKQCGLDIEAMSGCTALMC
jgi:hypothetical protein